MKIVGTGAAIRRVRTTFVSGKSGHAALRSRRRCLPRCLLVLGLLAATSTASDGPSTDELLEMEIDDLLNVDIAAVARREQPLSEVAAAATVLTAAELRRSGHTSLAEMLRLVPGFSVGQVDANKWSVAARGLPGRFTDKLLVLVDGRSVYTPTFAGVFWDAQHVFLPDLDRIEVVRGPGATVWGANAVNGVINVRTKSARETQGGAVQLGGGVEENAFGGVRYGGRAGDSVFFRVFLDGFLRDEHVSLTGGDGNDDWWTLRGGFRLDWEPEGDAEITIQGEVYAGERKERVTFPTLTPPFSTALTHDGDVAGGHLLVRWTQELGGGGEWELQATFDRNVRDSALAALQRNTFDLDFQHRLPAAGAHEVMWGAGYRLSRDSFSDSAAVSFDPSSRTIHLFSAFVQDQISVVPDRLTVTVGSKFEHNDFTGFEVQPGVRALWKPGPEHTVWFAATRAVRTPSRVDDDARVNLAIIDPATPTLAALFGQDSFLAEELWAFEAGTRFRAGDSVAIDLAAFLNRYNRLRSFMRGTPFLEASPAPPHAVLPLFFRNGTDGEILGFEIAVRWQVSSRWRILGHYGFSQAFLHAGGDRTFIDLEDAENRYPHHILSLRSLADLGSGWELDVSVYYADSQPTLGVDAYVRLDIRLGWRPTEHLRVDLVLRNALDDRHLEFLDELFSQGSEVQTAFFVRLSYSW